MTSVQDSMNSVSFREMASSEAHFLSTCDGGDIGSVATPSTWLMGVEPGNSLEDQRKDREGIKSASELDPNYSVDRQLTYPFNRTAFKLLSAIEGGSPEDYVAYARRARPYERGSKGHFKVNLFPVPFHNLKAWDEWSKVYTGFEIKSDYQAWVREVRFPVVSSQLEQHRPKLLIATGMAHLQDFKLVARATTLIEHRFVINGHKKRMFVSTDGLIPLVVLPHLSGGSGGLNSNAAVSYAARVIVEATQMTSCSNQ